MKTSEVRKQDRTARVMPLADIFETANEFSMKLEMAGVAREDVVITLEDNELQIEAAVHGAEEHDRESRRYREFDLANYYRKFRLGNDIDREGIQAILADGILTLKLQKAEEVKPKKIAINAH